MRRWEMHYPKFVVLVAFLCCVLNDAIIYALMNNIDKIINATITLSSIFLGFVGVMYGVVLGLKDSKIIKVLQYFKRMQDLNYFIQEARRANWIGLVLSLLLMLFIDRLEQFHIRIVTIVVVVVLLYMIVTSYRIIHILSVIMDNVYSENTKRLNKKMHTPSFLNENSVIKKEK